MTERPVFDAINHILAQPKVREIFNADEKRRPG